MASDGTNSVTRLNNFLQANGDPQARRLEWRIWSEGPEHSPVWRAISYIDGIAYGEGSGPSKAQAKEAAAQTTLAELQVPTQNTTRPFSRF